MIYKGLQARIHRLLTLYPEARERRNKDFWLVKLLTNKKQWDGEMCVFRLNELVDLAKDYATADRYWRQLTREHKDLRGKDWEEGQVLAQKKQINLGYESGYHENVRKLETVSSGGR